MTALDKGAIPKGDVTVDHARAAIRLENREVTSLVEKHFGKLAPATAGEKQARIAWLNTALGREKGDATRGKAVFTKHCAACHKLHGEGGTVGPDLTTADRKNRGYLLAQIVDPSGYIRPEYVVQNVLTTDERKLMGIATETGESITLVNVVNDQPVKAVIAKKDIAEIRPSSVSLMPEKGLDTLSDSEVADLFAYLMAETTPGRQSGGETQGLPRLGVVRVQVGRVSDGVPEKPRGELRGGMFAGVRHVRQGSLAGGTGKPGVV